MKGGAAPRSWIWTAVFSLVFLVLGVLDLVGGEALVGSGLLVCGAGSALFAVGDRVAGDAGEGRPWRRTGWRSGRRRI
jgi:hypothetical protein